MHEAFICDARAHAVRPLRRRAGRACAPTTSRAIPMRALMERNPGVDWAAVDDVIYGCANQAGEDNRNVARMALLLAGLPVEVPGTTVNRLCGSSLDAIGIAARAIKSGETSLMIAGGVESMSRAPFVMGKADSAFSRVGEDRGHDDRLALRQSADEGEVRHRLDAGDGRERRRRVQGIARRPGRVRAAQPAARGGRDAAGRLAEEIVAGHRSRRRRATRSSSTRDEHPRATRRSKRWPSSRASCGRTARSPRATRPASTTAPARCCSRRQSRGKTIRPEAEGARRRRRRPRAWRRASWASARRRPCARCSRRPA